MFDYLYFICIIYSEFENILTNNNMWWMIFIFYWKYKHVEDCGDLIWNMVSMIF